MATQYVDVNGTLIIPGAYPKVSVIAATGGIAATGVVMLVGEADTGPSYLDEDPTLNGYGPDQFSAVAAKFGGGSLVNGFRAAANPSIDAQVTGAPQRIYLVKTNTGAKASYSLSRSGLTAYGALRAKTAGQLGNLLYAVTTQTAEVSPATTFTYIPDVAKVQDFRLRINGGAEVTVQGTSAALTPAAWLGAVTGGTAIAPAGTLGAAGVLATGGQNRAALANTNGTLTVSNFGGASMTVTRNSFNWDVTPTVGDTCYIPTGSAIAGAASANCGFYIVTAATTTTVNVTKLHDVAASTVTNTVTATSGATPPTTTIQFFSPITLKNLAGTNRTAIGSVTGTLTGTGATATSITVTYSVAWANQPQVGDFVFVPNYVAANALATAIGGWSVVTASTSTTVTLTRLSDDRAPANFGAYTVLATSDFVVYRPGIDGVAKTIETTRGGTATGAFWYDSASFGIAAWDVTGASLLTTGTEATATINVARATDNIQEAYTVGGKVVFKIGYVGTSCSVNVGATSIVLTPAGGSGSPQTALYKDFGTLKDLAVWISSKTGFSCSVGSNAYNQLSPTVLDRGVYTAGSSVTSYPNQTAQIKADAYYTKLAIANSSTVEFATSPTAGIPDVQAITYFTGGAKGATTDLAVMAALAAAERVTANFVVPCFSRDAAGDIADSLTDSASLYTIAGINAAVLDHVTRMSQFKKRKPRQAFCSYRGTFNAAKSVAQGLASARAVCTFQDVKALASTGSIVQFQPWYGAALAAGFQAAAGYRPIFNKQLNCSGVIQAAGDFFDADDTNVEDAILAGMLVIRARQTGGFSFVSDQTTYGVDTNFVYNSIQAVYGADTCSMTIAQRMETAFVGQAFADVSAAIALSYLKGVLGDLRRLKFITASGDAPSGYKNASININAPAMAVSVELKLGTGIYFIPINVLVSQVTQTA